MLDVSRSASLPSRDRWQGCARLCRARRVRFQRGDLLVPLRFVRLDQLVNLGEDLRIETANSALADLDGLPVFVGERPPSR